MLKLLWSKILCCSELQTAEIKSSFSWIPEETHGKRFAVIENEFGEIGIDDKLIARREDLGAEQIIEMNNGCICCTATW